MTSSPSGAEQLEPAEPTPHEYGADYTEYQLNRSLFRRRVRKLYIRNLCKRFSGPVLDIGCGIGEILESMPSGSVGLEVNSATVSYCQERGLDVRHYDLSDAYQFKDFSHGQFQGIVMSHVLEHLDDPGAVMKDILNSAARLGMSRAVFVVPGWKGYLSDATHRVFVEPSHFRAVERELASSWKIVSLSYFPFFFGWVGKFFPHNELVVEFRN